MTFKKKDLKEFWDTNGKEVPKAMPSTLVKTALRKLQMIAAATNMNDLRVPPSNHLEKLVGDRLGQYSIAINNQYRFCFTWVNNEAKGVEFVDYHK